MEKESIRIVLAERKNIGGIIRNPGYVLLEGICPEKMTVDVGTSIQLGQIKVEVVRSKEKDKEAPR